MRNTFLSIALFALLGIFSLPSCMSPTPTPSPTNVSKVDSSWWVINTNRYVTNYTFVSGSPNTATVSGSAGNASFQITFQVPYIPAQGSYVLDCSSADASSACMEIQYNKLKYRAHTSPPIYIHADSGSQRAIISLNPSWFYNLLDPNDSISVNGIFHQPLP